MDTPLKGKSVSLTAVADRLGIDKSAASRRVKHAIDAGYLVNDEYRQGVAMKLLLGDPMPEDRQLLPLPEELMSEPTKAA